jgi:hypothetical protein
MLIYALDFKSQWCTYIQQWWLIIRLSDVEVWESPFMFLLEHGQQLNMCNEANITGSLMQKAHIFGHACYNLCPTWKYSSNFQLYIQFFWWNSTYAWNEKWFENVQSIYLGWVPPHWRLEVKH